MTIYLYWHRSMVWQYFFLSYFSRCDLVKCVFTDLLTLAKSLLLTENKEEIAPVLRLALGLGSDHDSNTSRGGSSEPNRLDWSEDRVDLQLSRCRLLLSKGEPTLYNSRSLETLLSTQTMYEVHHLILSHVMDNTCIGESQSPITKLTVIVSQ